jgi:predicted nucleotidyltransferase
MLNIGSKIVEKVLGYYFINLEARHYINELARLLSLDAGNLDRKLKELENEGIFASEKQGNLKYFFINKRYPLLEEIKKLYNLKYGIEKKLSDAFASLKGLKEIYIFGSYTKNKLSAESDIDILLIGNHSSLQAKRLIAGLSDDLGRELNIVDMTLEELEKRKENKDEFIENIFKNKIIKIK